MEPRIKKRKSLHICTDTLQTAIWMHTCLALTEPSELCLDSSSDIPHVPTVSDPLLLSCFPAGTSLISNCYAVQRS